MLCNSTTRALFLMVRGSQYKGVNAFLPVTQDVNPADGKPTLYFTIIIIFLPANSAAPVNLCNCWR